MSGITIVDVIMVTEELFEAQFSKDYKREEWCFHGQKKNSGKCHCEEEVKK